MSIVVPQDGAGQLGCSIPALSATRRWQWRYWPRVVYIVLPPISPSGAVRRVDDVVYHRMVDNGFSKKVVMEGTGAKAGESYAWAIANPDKVSVIYARNPLMRSLMSKTPPIENPAKAGRGCADLYRRQSLDPWLKDQTRVVEKRYKELGGNITVLVAEGDGHFPLSR